jgi:hypothetical protein
LPAGDLVLEPLVVLAPLSELALELAIGLLQGKHLGAKQVELQNQRGYRDILVCHRRGYTGLPSFAPVQNLYFKKIFFGIP